MGPPPETAQLTAMERVAHVEVGPFRLEWMDEPWADVDAAGAWLIDLERRVRPDVVHLNGFCHAGLPWNAPVTIVAHSCVCSWWRAVHGVDAPAAVDRYRDRVAAGLRGASLVIAPGRAMLQALAREYDVSSPARVIPNGRADLRRPLRLDRKEPLVFGAGRLWDEAKNLQTLCLAASSLSWPVVVAGNHRSPDGYSAATGYVRHVGCLDRVTMDDWLARASIYALPARYEPFGLSVLEAAAAGCALVLGDIASLRENWSGAALFVPPDNRRALIGAIERLAASPEERNQLAECAHARSQRFTVEAMTTAYLSAYAEMLALRRSA
jgi:glycosyltransferase involved in cell wall biosynthesis